MIVKDMVRDDASGALLSTDASGLEQYKLARARTRELNTMKEDMSTLKHELADIKNLLRTLVNDG